MNWRNVLILVTPAYQPRLAGIARYARQHNWQLTILDRIARQLFEHELGHTAGEEILRQRIDMAKRLLKNDSLSVSEIAYRTGFCNPAYFTNTFRRVTGLTPKGWRRSIA